jgi:hypothetical protein
MTNELKTSLEASLNLLNISKVELATKLVNLHPNCLNARVTDKNLTKTLKAIEAIQKLIG